MIMAPRGPRSVLCVVVMTTSACGAGSEWTAGPRRPARGGAGPGGPTPRAGRSFPGGGGGGVSPSARFTVDYQLLEDPFTQLSAGDHHNCGLRLDGSVRCWVHNDFGQAADRPGPYVEVSAGSYHTCATTAAGDTD